MMAPTDVSHELYDRLGRVVAEYREMPGLALTVSQAARLWGVRPPDADWILRELTATGFLSRTTAGAYVMNRD